MEQKGVLNAFALKIMMAVCMLLDHLYYFMPWMGFPIWFTGLGRLVAPTFCFLMTQSLVHTRDRSRYIRRMAKAGGIMWAGSLLLMTIYRKTLTNSVFLSLALSAALVDTLERMGEGEQSGREMAKALLLLALCPLVEGGAMIPILAIIFYFLRDHRGWMSLAYLAGSTGLSWMEVGPSTNSPRYNLMFSSGFALHVQYLQAFALIPILLYNGKPGPRNAFSRYFFYLFYPIHVWALYLIAVNH